MYRADGSFAAGICCGNISDERIFLSLVTVIDALIWVRDQSLLTSDTLQAELAGIITQRE